MADRFELVSPFQPAGDQPQAIRRLIDGFEAGLAHQTLLGVTGSGKTFTIANVVQAIQRPTLVLAPNKTLAAQLYGEFKEFFPHNAVEYFVSYYDYYQPEAYVPSSDTYIEKDSSINDEIDRMRHAATHALLTRNDVLIVASVSCIYGLGTAEAYFGLLQQVERGQEFLRDRFIRSLIDIQYERNDIDFHRGTFRVRGDTIEVFPPYEEDRAIRIEFFGDTVESIHEFDPLRGLTLAELDKVAIFPNSHYVSAPETRKRAIDGIRGELLERLQQGHQDRAHRIARADDPGCHPVDGTDSQSAQDAGVVAHVMRHFLAAHQIDKTIAGLLIREHIIRETLVSFPGNRRGDIQGRPPGRAHFARRPIRTADQAQPESPGCQRRADVLCDPLEHLIGCLDHDTVVTHQVASPEDREIRQRIAAVRYYAGDVAACHAALERIAARGCRFLAGEQLWKPHQFATIT